MNALETMLRTVAGSLRDRHLPWALVGGLAVSVRTEPRFTRDIEMAEDRDFNGALEACRLIEKRKFNRSRDLARALTEAWDACRQRVD